MYVQPCVYIKHSLTIFILLSKFYPCHYTQLTTTNSNNIRVHSLLVDSNATNSILLIIRKHKQLEEQSIQPQEYHGKLTEYKL